MRAALAILLLALGQDAAPKGVEIRYELPAGARTARVTLAIVDAKNPDWIISQFVAGAVRTVTAENKGKFTETWDGLDDNFMPVPPGEYAVKGIYAEAKPWAVDGEPHAITPRFVAGASSWMPRSEDGLKPEPFGGDPCGAPLEDIDVGPDGIAVFYYGYLENGTNNPQFDLKRPVNYAQFLRAYGSGGAGGGSSTCTDGKTVWSYSTDGGPKYVYRADGKSFGTGRAQRNNVYRPDGWVTAMAYGNSTVYVAERGKLVMESKKEWDESEKEFVDKITMLAAEDGKILGSIPVRRPQGLVARDGTLYVLHEEVSGFRVSRLKDGKLELVFALPDGVRAFDLERDAKGRFYYSVPTANKVVQVDAKGAFLRAFGRLDRQKPGTYDRETFIAPGKLACWTDPKGEGRLIVVERGGPNRASEWSAEDGKLLREFQSLQTKANDGYACDPEHPTHYYVGGQQGWLTRFIVDAAAGIWTVDAVWPDVGTDLKLPHFDHPRFIRANGGAFLACARSRNVYRLVGDRWVLSAGIVSERVGNRTLYFAWNDADGNGRVDEAEYLKQPLDLPGHWFRYHGEQWLEDLSLVALPQGGREAWRLSASGFDPLGNPKFTVVEKLFSDPVFDARAAKTADATHGGNEVGDSYSSDWAQADGLPGEGFYVNARGGPNFSANEGAQIKISRYVPDGPGKYRLMWRTGRIAIQGTARGGELYGTIHLHKPVNGLLSVVDQSRCGIALYTESGLYVDTIFPDPRVHPHSKAGLYPQPGEFFAGEIHANKDNGKIYLAMGKITPLLFEVDGWSLKENPVRPLTVLDKAVVLKADRIADPPERALAVRGGAGKARLAKIAPALGGVALDGSMDGWEACDPVHFESDKEQTVEVRCFYDPEHLHLRWHARLGRAFEARALQPIERMFTHDRQSDTLSVYLQGDPSAPPGKGVRAGDVRIVFGIFKDGADVKPAALGMHPKWDGKGTAQTYRTPVGSTDFEHVGPVAGAALGHRIDPDGKGFVLAASIPRSALPRLPLLSGGVRTLMNFEATFGGHNKFWWANSDGSASRETFDEPTEARLYPGSWAPVQFEGLDRGVVVRHWQINGPWGGPGAEVFKADLSGNEKDKGRKFAESAKYPPDAGFDASAKYRGELSRGYWNDPGEVKWKLAQIADLDTRVVLGPSVEVWYGATWVHAPEDVEVDFQLQGHPQTYLRYTLNGEAIFSGETKEQKGNSGETRRVKLKQGWNAVGFRGFCVGYPPFRAGLVIAGAPEQLWKLKLSAQPPDSKR